VSFDRARFTKLCMMFTSPHEGEQINALRMANKMLADAKLSWAEALNGPASQPSPFPQYRSQQPPPGSDIWGGQRASPFDSPIFEEMLRKAYQTKRRQNEEKARQRDPFADAFEAGRRGAEAAAAAREADRQREEMRAREAQSAEAREAGRKKHEADFGTYHINPGAAWWRKRAYQRDQEGWHAKEESNYANSKKPAGDNWSIFDADDDSPGKMPAAWTNFVAAVGVPIGLWVRHQRTNNTFCAQLWQQGMANVAITDVQIAAVLRLYSEYTEEERRMGEGFGKDSDFWK
jgi:hypothetical protein